MNQIVGRFYTMEHDLEMIKFKSTIHSLKTVEKVYLKKD